MAKYVFIYHGGKMPESEEEGAKVMAEWQAWLGGMGDAVVDPGNPVGLSSTVHSNGTVSDDGGSNPVSLATVWSMPIAWHRHWIRQRVVRFLRPMVRSKSPKQWKCNP